MNDQNIRYERKIHLLQLNEDRIQSFIKTHPYGFKEIYYKRQVNSLYYDTPSFNSFLDNEIGASRRAKVRIRWYGKSLELPKKTSHLEIKIKNGNVGSKIVTKWKDLFDFRISAFIKIAKPVILVSYQRRYFLSFDKKFRLTVDSEIEYRSGNHVYQENGCVMEIKYERAFDDIAKNIIKLFPGRVGKFSKYARGIARVYGK